MSLGTCILKLSFTKSLQRIHKWCLVLSWFALVAHTFEKTPMLWSIARCHVHAPSRNAIYFAGHIRLLLIIIRMNAQCLKHRSHRAHNHQRCHRIRWAHHHQGRTSLAHHQTLFVTAILSTVQPLRQTKAERVQVNVVTLSALQIRF